MTVLVGYASAHGSTRGVAERVGARLTEQGHESEVRALGQVRDVHCYDVFVLGSAVHDQAWLPEATEFVRHNLGLLTDQRDRPVFTFSVGTIGEHSSMIAPVLTRWLRSFGESKNITRITDALCSRDHHKFAGVLESGHYSLIGRLIFRAMGGRFGDHRNWREIDSWAQRIGQELTAAQRH